MTHDVIVVLDDGPPDDAPRLAHELFVDGERVWVPGGATVRAEVGNETPATVTLTIFASSVQFVRDLERPA